MFRAVGFGRLGCKWASKQRANGLSEDVQYTWIFELVFMRTCRNAGGGREQSCKTAGVPSVRPTQGIGRAIRAFDERAMVSEHTRATVH